MLNLIRTVTLGVWLTTTVVPVALSIVLASAFVRGKALFAFARLWCQLALWGAERIAGVHARVHGWDHVASAHAANQRLVICAKHQSAWETFFFLATMPRPLAYVFKKELLWVPFFGWALARMDMVHIDRSARQQSSRKVAEQGRLMMDRGNWVILFPEGTRGPRGGQLPYKLGAARLAVATDTPVLPVAVTSARCWPKARWVIEPGVIDVSFGRPIPPQGRDAQALMDEVERWIEADMRRLDPDAYRGQTA